MRHAAPGARSDPDVGVEVYCEGYTARLVEALASDYPQLSGWLGPEQFADLARSYLHAHPSRNPSLRWLGAEFPAFISNEQALPHSAFCAEIARFEWALTEVFDAADARPLEIAALKFHAPEQWPRLLLVFLPALRILYLDWNSVA
ncbi:MAG: HvfC/BufC family peptide modification chaperone, partial [Gammaproteobacteria bacterium]